MGRFALRELARFALLLFAVSLATFALVSLSPIDPVQANVGQQALVGVSAEKRAQLAAHWGVGVPLWERYVSWLGGVLHGDWGTSLRFNAPVAQVVGERFARSFALMATAWALSGVLGLALGMVSGARVGSTLDNVIRRCCIVLSATPAFWVGIVALMVFSVWLGWFPLGFSTPIGVDPASVTVLDRVRHMVLPALVLSLTSMPSIALHTREKVVDVMASDYVRFARARGESTTEILRRHGVRNVVLPALTLQFASIGEIFGGSVLVEQVFSYPGLGQAAITAGLGGDAPLLVGIALASVAFVFGGNMLANVLYRVIDPRVAQRGGYGLE
ncbi:MAG: ABC transporter permease [Coriobacteriaceae bacterium]|nr:ABC transporter permease [Coriobacteriaceae bacterium]